jgi:hypothetical protein
VADQQEPSEPTDPLQRSVSRRSLITGLFASVKRVAASGAPEPAPPPPPSPAVPRDRVDTSRLPGAGQIRSDAETMASFGPRFPGSGAHHEYLAWTARELERAGCYLRSSTERTDTLWVPQSWGLSIASGPDAGEVPVATFRARSGASAPDGSAKDAPVRGRLVYLGSAPAPQTEGRDLATARAEHQSAMKERFATELRAREESTAGAILVVDLGAPPHFTQGTMGAMAGCYYTQTPNHLTWPLWNQRRSYRKLWMLPDPGDAIPSFAAPAGVIYLVDACYDELKDQFLPASGAPESVPALVLDRDAAARVRAAAREGQSADLHLSATTQPARFSDLTFKLPGTVEDELGGAPDADDRLAHDVEYVLINATSDGVSAVHGNGCIAIVNIARYFAALKARGDGLRRTLVFSIVAGALGSGTAPKARGFVENHPRIMARAAFAMNLENLGCAEWVEGERGFAPTGMPEPAVIYHDEGLTPLVYDSYIGIPLLNHGISTGRAHYFGIGRAIAATVPTVSFVAGPTYVHQGGPGFRSAGPLDYFDPELCARQVRLFIDVLAGLDRMPAAGGAPAA